MGKLLKGNTSLLKKYEPKEIGVLLRNSDKAYQVKKWVNDWRPGRLLLLGGPEGSGKTLAINLIAKELGLEIVELNASHLRTYQGIKETLIKSSKQKSLFHRKKLLVIDELEDSTISMKGLKELVKESKYPVIVITSKPFEKRLYHLRKNAMFIRFEKPGTQEMAKFLEMICKKEGLAYEKQGLIQLARISNGDVRSALIDLDILSHSKITTKNVSKVGYRESENDIFRLLQVIFKSSSLEHVMMSVRQSERPVDEIFFWLEENLPKEYDKKALATALDYLSKADIFSSRIIRRQAWSLKKYQMSLTTLGVALSKERAKPGFTRYDVPKFFASKSLTISEELCKRLHVSKRKLSEYSKLLEVLNRC
jgi:replication factor C large subunit